jgi:hypothetical protein
MDFAPPVWLQYLIPPELAVEFALAYAIITAGNPQFDPNGMISPWNVALGPAGLALPGDRFVGLGNAAGGVIFGSYINGTGFTANTFPSANVPGSNLQGFLGSPASASGGGIQLRVTSALDSAGTATLTYHYLDASHNTLQSATVTSGSFSGTAAGSVATVTVTAGRLVQNVSAVGSISGMTTGSFCIEAAPVRNY